MSDLAKRFWRRQVRPSCSTGTCAPSVRRGVAAIVLLGPMLVCGAFANTPGEKLLVVDCLLPSQVRQLGTGFTYLAPRQAIKTSGGDCELRGGEYTAADRGGGAAALRVWLPQAEQGDKTAQTYVGEIFEKGLGTQPDYQAAAAWYQKAAVQGYSRAMINLGFLYEKGLGVDKDPVAALNWYRKASGLNEAIRLDADMPPNRDAELKELRNELERARQQLDRAKAELERERARSKLELEKLRAEQKAASSAGNTAETQRLEKALQEKEAASKQRESEFAALEQAANRQREQLAAAEKERAMLKARLDESERAAAAARDELARRQQTADQAKSELARLQKDAQAQAQKGAASEAAQARVKAMEDELARRERELGEQRAKIAKLELAADATRDQVQQPVALASKPGAPVAGPSIQLIDPDLVLTRSPMVVQLRGELKYRDVVGRVLAPAGLLSFTVNDRTLVPDANGLFKTRIDVSPPATKVDIVAVDRAGSTARMDFLFQALEGGGTSVVAAPRARPDLNFGRYHALVIGNQKYTSLPVLETPEADAKSIAEILSTRYGFTVKTLLNATRYDILSELNRLRGALTEKDNLLVYYAGHGELDRVNQRGYWLPVDAEANSDANWISSVAITDILNVMSVKQAIVIADSCYSGALTRSSLGRLESGMSDEARVNWLRSIAKSRSRTVLTSGGVKPVLDGGGGEHSVFAQILIRILSENTEILEAQRVYQELSARVLNAAMKARFEQRPEYAPMRFAGHESGDFLFVPRAP
jgi:multidrug efflux pump subunit AcrA (membrane-fusion protein)